MAGAGRSEPEREPVWLLPLLAFYNVALAVLATYTLVKVWPTNPTEMLNSTSVSNVVLFNYSFPVGAEIRILLIVITLGALGSFIHTATSLATYVGNRSFKRSWTLWYLVRPPIGSTLAVVIYFAFRAGFLNPSIDLSSINLYGIAAVSGFAGMFSKEATDKLSDVFETLFKSDKNQTRGDKGASGQGKSS